MINRNSRWRRTRFGLSAADAFNPVKAARMLATETSGIAQLISAERTVAAAAWLVDHERNVDQLWTTATARIVALGGPGLTA
ncbi:hypothetical protein [Bradyrhizobium sp. B117]|uniref:hypothetical protein n=1 Tax=Bradyrhizobium sp. B117 TaxID=3140246 RepID=UPI0031844E38